MSKPKVTNDEVAVVLVGAFNPAIFQPAWLAQYGLVQSHEADAADVQVISPAVSSFSLKWAGLDVTRDRFTIRSNDETHFEPLRDLVIGIFRLLEHTPIRQMGLNRDMQFEFSTEDEWHHVGHTLSPKEIWKKYVKEPGLMNLQIRAERQDDIAGAINISVFPSGPKRATIAVNDHYEFSEGNGRSIGDVISSRWDLSLQQSKELVLAIYAETTA